MNNIENWKKEYPINGIEMRVPEMTKSIFLVLNENSVKILGTDDMVFDLDISYEDIEEVPDALVKKLSGLLCEAMVLE